MFTLKGQNVSWRTKLQIQRALAMLPVPVGDSVYHLMQEVNGGLRPNAKRHARFVERCARSLAATGRGSLEGKGIVELGSGWFPVTPLLLLSRGVRGVETFDLRKHYSRKRICKAARAVLRRAAHPEVEAAAADGALPEGVCYHPRTDLATVELPAKSVDVAVSQFVLEHVRPEDIERIHRASRSWLTDDGLWIHWISPGDHRAYGHGSLSGVDFLRYSPAEWERIAGNRFAYHNRLRRSQYRELFERSGWRPMVDEAEVSPRAREQLAALPLHRDFADLPADDLVAGSLWFVLEKKTPEPARPSPRRALVSARDAAH